jgi:uncharacterized protein YjiS (DUF1127 family)
MSMQSDLVPQMLRPHPDTQGFSLRTAADAAHRAVRSPIATAERLCNAFIVNQMRWRMRRALRPLSDGLLADLGVSRDEIETFVVELFPHRVGTPPA